MSDSLETVQNVLIELGISASDIHADASLFEDLSIDSTEMIEVVTSIEKKTQVHLDEKRLKNVHTVAELAALVDTYLLNK